MDNFGIYDDLEDFASEEAQKNKEFTELEKKYESALQEIENLKKENQKLESEMVMMKKNFQILLDTAKTEIARKDRRITELNKEKDDICFRRKRPKFDNNEAQIAFNSGGRHRNYGENRGSDDSRTSEKRVDRRNLDYKTVSKNEATKDQSQIDDSYHKIKTERDYSKNDSQRESNYKHLLEFDPDTRVQCKKDDSKSFGIDTSSEEYYRREKTFTQRENDRKHSHEDKDDRKARKDGNHFDDNRCFKSDYSRADKHRKSPVEERKNVKNIKDDDKNDLHKVRGEKSSQHYDYNRSSKPYRECSNDDIYRKSSLEESKNVKQYKDDHKRRESKDVTRDKDIKYSESNRRSKIPFNEERGSKRRQEISQSSSNTDYDTKKDLNNSNNYKERVDKNKYEPSCKGNKSPPRKNDCHTKKQLLPTSHNLSDTEMKISRNAVTNNSKKPSCYNSTSKENLKSIENLTSETDATSYICNILKPSDETVTINEKEKTLLKESEESFNETICSTEKAKVFLSEIIGSIDEIRNNTKNVGVSSNENNVLNDKFLNSNESNNDICSMIRENKGSLTRVPQENKEYLLHVNESYSTAKLVNNKEFFLVEEINTLRKGLPCNNQTAQKNLNVNLDRVDQEYYLNNPIHHEQYILAASRKERSLISPTLQKVVETKNTLTSKCLYNRKSTEENNGKDAMKTNVITQRLICKKKLVPFVTDNVFCQKDLKGNEFIDKEAFNRDQVDTNSHAQNNEDTKEGPNCTQPQEILKHRGQFDLVPDLKNHLGLSIDANLQNDSFLQSFNRNQKEVAQPDKVSTLLNNSIPETIVDSSDNAEKSSSTFAEASLAGDNTIKKASQLFTNEMPKESINTFNAISKPPSFPSKYSENTEVLFRGNDLSERNQYNLLESLNNSVPKIINFVIENKADETMNSYEKIRSKTSVPEPITEIIQQSFASFEKNRVGTNKCLLEKSKEENSTDSQAAGVLLVESTKNIQIIEPVNSLCKNSGNRNVKANNLSRSRVKFLDTVCTDPPFKSSSNSESQPGYIFSNSVNISGGHVKDFIPTNTVGVLRNTLMKESCVLTSSNVVESNTPNVNDKIVTSLGGNALSMRNSTDERPERQSKNTAAVEKESSFSLIQYSGRDVDNAAVDKNLEKMSISKTAHANGKFVLHNSTFSHEQNSDVEIYFSNEEDDKPLSVLRDIYKNQNAEINMNMKNMNSVGSVSSDLLRNSNKITTIPIKTIIACSINNDVVENLAQKTKDKLIKHKRGGSTDKQKLENIAELPILEKDLNGDKEMLRNTKKSVVCEIAKAIWNSNSKAANTSDSATNEGDLNELKTQNTVEINQKSGDAKTLLKMYSKEDTFSNNSFKQNSEKNEGNSVTVFDKLEKVSNETFFKNIPVCLKSESSQHESVRTKEKKIPKGSYSSNADNKALESMPNTFQTTNDSEEGINRNNSTLVTVSHMGQNKSEQFHQHNNKNILQGDHDIICSISGANNEESKFKSATKEKVANEMESKKLQIAVQIDPNQKGATKKNNIPKKEKKLSFKDEHKDSKGSLMDKCNLQLSQDKEEYTASKNKSSVKADSKKINYKKATRSAVKNSIIEDHNLLIHLNESENIVTKNECNTVLLKEMEKGMVCKSKRQSLSTERQLFPQIDDKKITLRRDFKNVSKSSTKKNTPEKFNSKQVLQEFKLMEDYKELPQLGISKQLNKKELNPKQVEANNDNNNTKTRRHLEIINNKDSSKEGDLINLPLLTSKSSNYVDVKDNTSVFVKYVSEEVSDINYKNEDSLKVLPSDVNNELSGSATTLAKTNISNLPARCTKRRLSSNCMEKDKHFCPSSALVTDSIDISPIKTGSKVPSSGKILDTICDSFVNETPEKSLDGIKHALVAENVYSEKRSPTSNSIMLHQSNDDIEKTLKKLFDSPSRPSDENILNVTNLSFNPFENNMSNLTNCTVDETLENNSTSEINSCKSFNVSEEQNSSNSINVAKSMSLGSRDYRIEIISDNQIKLCVTRKKRRKT